MAEPMADKYLERLAGLSELPCSCGIVDCEIYASALTAHQAQELIAETKRARHAETALRAQLAELGNAGVQWGVQVEHGSDAFPARTRELAEKLAAQYSRLREPGCRPTPWHVVRRVRTNWERVEQEADRG